MSAVFPPNIPSVLADHQRRIRALEANKPGGGLQFDTYPQNGDWFYAETTSSIDGPTWTAIRAAFPGMGAGLGWISAPGFLLADSGSGITIYSKFDEVRIGSSGNDVTVESKYEARLLGEGILISGATNGVTMQATNGGGMIVGSDFADLQIRVGNGGNLIMGLLTAGEKVRVNDHLGASLFEVREDGSVHGLASVGAITWDL